MVNSEKELIMIADDEEEWFNIINNNLNGQYECVHVNDFIQLNEIASKRKPYLIMLDSVYAGEKKDNITKFIKHSHENKSIIVLFTRRNVSQDMLNRIGAISFIDKPAEPTDVNILKVLPTIEKYVLMSKCERLTKECDQLKQNFEYDITKDGLDSLKNCLQQYPDQTSTILSDGEKKYSINNIIEELEVKSDIGKRLFKSWIDLLIKMSVKDGLAHGK